MIIRYGKIEVSEIQQGSFLRDFPAPLSRDCYFGEVALVALLMRAGGSKVCKHCGHSSHAAVSPRQARMLAKRLLHHWRQCHLVTYSGVMDKYRRLP